MFKVVFSIVSILFCCASIYCIFKGLNSFEPLVIGLLTGMWAKLED